MSLSEFELMPNGSKPDLLRNLRFWPSFAPYFDSKLRNGIGHHSMQYDVATDTIHYQNNSEARGLEQFEIAYLDFCIKTRKLYHIVGVGAKYVHSVWC